MNDLSQSSLFDLSMYASIYSSIDCPCFKKFHALQLQAGLVASAELRSKHVQQVPMGLKLPGLPMVKSCSTNLAMPCLASNDQEPALAFSFQPCLAVQVMTKGQHQHTLY